MSLSNEMTENKWLLQSQAERGAGRPVIIGHVRCTNQVAEAWRMAGLGGVRWTSKVIVIKTLLLFTYASACWRESEFCEGHGLSRDWLWSSVLGTNPGFWLIIQVIHMLLPHFHHLNNSHCSSACLTGSWSGSLMAEQMLSPVAGTSYLLDVIIMFL